MLSNCYDKIYQSQSQSSKKKKAQSNGVIDNHVIEVLTAKEKLALTVDVLRMLRAVLNVSESSLGKKT